MAEDFIQSLENVSPPSFLHELQQQTTPALAILAEHWDQIPGALYDQTLIKV